MFSKTGVVGIAHDLYAWDRQQLELTVCKDSVSDTESLWIKQSVMSVDYAMLSCVFLSHVG